MDSIISTFHIDWKIIIAQAVNFGVVFVVLYIFALKPLSKLMAERGDRIAKGIDDAKSNAIVLEKTKNEYDAVIIKARAEADKLFQDTKKQAEAERLEMVEKTKNEVTDMVTKGKQSLEIEKRKIVEEAKADIASLAMLATEKLIGKRGSGSIEEKAVNELSEI